jgi:hypothetical protein
VNAPNFGDVVELAPGNYGSPVAPLQGVMLSTQVEKIAPAVGAGRPHLYIGGTGYLSIYNGGTIADVDIDSTSTSSSGTIFGYLPVLRRVTVRSKNNTACNLLHTATLENTLCATSAPGAAGVAFRENGGYPHQLNLRNVTASSSDPAGTGLTVSSSAMSPVTGSIVNSIMRGGAADVVVTSDGASGTTAAISVANSNFATGLAVGNGASLSPPGSNANQAAPPLFANPGAFDFNPTIGSPTIDAGATSAAEDLFDAANHVRIQGAGTDIGAYEFTPIASTITALSIAPAKFRPAKSGAMIAKSKKKKKPKAPVSGNLLIAVNQTSQVAVTIERAKAGRKTAAGCVGKTKKNAKRKKCTRYVQVLGITNLTVPTGSLTVKISGRDAKKKKFVPGKYRVKAIPTAVGAAPGLPAYAKFSIVN